MRNSNFFTLRGRTCNDIELKQTNDFSVCNFKLAVDRPYRKDKERETDFFYVTAYRSSAEFMAKYVQKGTMIAVTGELRVHNWEDDGLKKSRVELIAEQIEFAGPKASSSEDGVEKPMKKQAVPEDIEVDEPDDLPF